jgi:quercetin dioxygenase-like cupin family protein
METNDGGEITQESPEGRHNRHHHPIYQHCLDGQLESPLNEMDDHRSASPGDIGEEVED